MGDLADFVWASIMMVLFVGFMLLTILLGIYPWQQAMTLRTCTTLSLITSNRTCDSIVNDTCVACPIDFPSCAAAQCGQRCCLDNTCCAFWVDDTCERFVTGLGYRNCDDCYNASVSLLDGDGHIHNISIEFSNDVAQYLNYVALFNTTGSHFACWDDPKTGQFIYDPTNAPEYTTSLNLMYFLVLPVICLCMLSFFVSGGIALYKMCRYKTQKAHSQVPTTDTDVDVAVVSTELTAQQDN